MQKTNKNRLLKRWLIRIAVLLVLVAVAVVAMWQVPWQLTVAQNKKEPLYLPEGFTITAAPGAQKTDANSMESFRQSIAYFVQNQIDGVIEADVRFLEDGTPVLSANAVGEGKNLATVDELLAAVKETPNLAVALCLKEKSNLTALHKLVDKHQLLGRVYYTGIVAEDVAHVRANGGKVPYYIDVELTERQAINADSLEALASAIVQQGAMGIRLNWRQATSSLIMVMRTSELKVSLTGVDKTDVMHVAIGYAPDNVVTQRPDLLFAVVQEREALGQGMWGSTPQQSNQEESQSGISGAQS